MKNDLLLPIAFVALSLAFFVIALLFFLSGNKSATLLKNKMKIGAILLTFSSTIAIGQTPVKTCYKPMVHPVDELTLFPDERQDNILIFNKSAGKLLKGMINHRQSAAFSYRIISKDNKTVQQENLYAKDGAFDKDTEAVEINIEYLEPGSYMLNIYRKQLEALEPNEYHYRSYSFEIQ